MGRGLDGYFFFIGTRSGWLCSFQVAARVGGLSRFAVAIARGKHLFPFRTEQLSLSAPMVLGSQGPGRVGRRRFTFTSRPSGGGSSSLEEAPSGASVAHAARVTRLRV
jgi:hypothetical protein